LVGLICSNDVPKYDVVIIGTGIVGLATAQELILRHPNLKFCVVDKEPKIGRFLSELNL
jgi:2-hydroxyglutarate dehydrogenase